MPSAASSVSGLYAFSTFGSFALIATAASSVFASVAPLLRTTAAGIA